VVQVEDSLSMDKKYQSIWFTWERQRRTDELAAALNIPVCRYTSDHSYGFRVLCLATRTLLKLMHARPHKVVVQNPSQALTALVCFLQPLLRYRLIVDRHSNFKFDTMNLMSLKYRIFHILSRYTVRKADLTIVTNEFLKNVVEEWGGRGFVLPDKLPILELADKISLPGKHNIVFVCTYGDDEPVEEVLQSARLVNPSTVIHVTGDYRKAQKTMVDSAPPNVVFTGFLDEKDYQSLLGSCDTVMVLTTQDHTLLCGAYEAVSLGKPLILSKQPTLMSYFCKGTVYTKNEAAGIARAIETAIDRRDALEREMVELVRRLCKSWQAQFEDLLKRIETL